MTPIEVRSQLVAALQLDLVGPHERIGDVAEILPQHPSRWYLTGFLVPFEAGENQANDADAGDDIDGAGERGGTDDNQTPEQVAASKTRFPSSMGLSALLPIKSKQLQVTVDWGDYSLMEPTLEQPKPEKKLTPSGRALTAMATVVSFDLACLRQYPMHRCLSGFFVPLEAGEFKTDD